MDKGIIIGIDCGASGGIAYVHGQTMRAIKMPLGGDLQTLIDTIKALPSSSIVAYIEKVGLWGSDVNHGKMFRMQAMVGMYYVIMDALRRNGIRCVEVAPQTWQSKLGLLKKRSKSETKTEKKRRHCALASSMHPELKVTLYNVDAILLCEYGKMHSSIDTITLMQRGQNKLF
jgi:hypothetical protein